MGRHHFQCARTFNGEGFAFAQFDAIGTVERAALGENKHDVAVNDGTVFV